MICTAAVFNNIRKWINYYGDFDPNNLDKDLFAEYTHICFKINGDGHFFLIRPDGFPTIRSGADIYNTGNVEVKLYCFPEETLIPLMIFEEEEIVDETVKQIVKFFSMMIETLV